jgi:hypothetical protein
MADLWYMVYRGPDGAPKTVKGTTESVRRNAQGGTIGAVSDILVCRTKHGAFKPLRDVPEFRDLAPPPDPPQPPPPSGRYVVAPDAAAAPLSGKFAVAPPDTPAAALKGDTTEVYTVTPVSLPPTDRVPAVEPLPWRRLLPWAIVAAVAAAAGAGVTLLVK